MNVFLSFFLWNHAPLDWPQFLMAGVWFRSIGSGKGFSAKLAPEAQPICSRSVNMVVQLG